MRVADDLRRRVTGGEFPVGAKLPSLRRLAEHYDVSEVTAHTAIRTLQSQGVLQSTSGRGTFVLALPTDGEPGTVHEQLATLRSAVDDLTMRVGKLEGHVQQSTAAQDQQP